MSGDPSWGMEYGGAALAAAMGSVARGRRWTDPASGKFSFGRFVAEAGTALALSFVVIAGMDYFHWDYRVALAIAVFCGWLGPAAVADIAERFFPQSKGPKDGKDDAGH